MGKQTYNTFKFIFPSNMVINLVAGGDDRQLVPNKEYETHGSFLLKFNPNGHEIKVTDSWFGEVEPVEEDPSYPGFYIFIFRTSEPPSGIDDTLRVITIKDLSDSGSGINFTYDKTPKFREQETPHVYFDTIDGSVARTETRTLTYADGTVSGVIYDDGDPEQSLNLKKICEFMDASELDGVLATYGSRSETIQGDRLENEASDMPGYSGEYAFFSELSGVRDAVFIDIDSAYSYAGFAEFPEPGLYVPEGMSFTFEVEIPPETNPFSKNVTVKAHTEYTAHINGRIGESSGILNGYGFSKIGIWRQSDYSDIQVANCDGSFETAQAVLSAGNKVIGFISTSDKGPLEPFLFETIVEDFFGSGLTGIKVDISVRYSCLLASDNKLYLHWAE